MVYFVHDYTKFKVSAIFSLQVIQKHFLRKKEKVLTQCQTWLDELKELGSKRKAARHHYEAMKTHVAELKIELNKLEIRCSQDNANTKQNENGEDECTASTIL